MIYPDTNILASLLLNEQRADDVVSKLEELDRKICLSNWTLHELYCTLAKAFRAKRIIRKEYDRLFVELPELIARLNIGATLIKLEPYHLENFGSIILLKPELDIRAADSVHLSILYGREDLTFLTADSRLFGSAIQLNIDCILIP